MTYQIRIDNQLYEGSSKEEEAVKLYNSVDRTCLRQYLGHEKTLVLVDGDKEEELRKGKIKPMAHGLRL